MRGELPQPGWSLRRWAAPDTQALQRIANDEAIARWMHDGWPWPYTAEAAQWWIDVGSRQGSCWAICLDDVPQGGCGLHPQQGFQRCNAEVGWWLSPRYWGHGVATWAAKAVVAEALALDGISRVFAAVHAGNLRSMRVAEKTGLRLESIQPRSAIKWGQVIDRHLYAAYC